MDYSECDVLAREVGDAMLLRLEWMTLKPKVILDAGCGTGAVTAQLQKRYPDAQLIAIDHSPDMLAYAKAHCPNLTYHCTDAAVLPLPDQSVDLVFANFLVPWHADITSLLREWKRVLREDGLLIFTALGPDTLKEWRGVLSEDVSPLLVDMHDVGDGLLQAGFMDPVLDVDHYTMTYRDQEKLLYELHASGMIGARLSCEKITTVPKTDEGTWPVTYEVIYAHAFVPVKRDEISASEDGVVRIPLAHLRQRMRGN